MTKSAEIKNKPFISNPKKVVAINQAMPTEINNIPINVNIKLVFGLFVLFDISLPPFIFTKNTYKKI